MGRSIQAAQRGDVDLLRLTAISCLVGAAVFLVVILALFASYMPAQICARLLRKIYPDRLVLAASMKFAGELGDFDKSSLGAGDHRPPVYQFAVMATDQDITFWAGVRQLRKFLQIPWSLVKDVRVDQDQELDKRYLPLSIEFFDPTLASLKLRVAADTWLGFSQFKINELERVAHRLDELRSAKG
ncbi:hypothetical protein QN355_09970 [Cryobacterium sp. 10S3]|uniref:hypothetical protein n=1 Tax=Cryobacterium sp. 10S3 TaxID=3048582 RepID=UPI002AC94CCC|nr:hypothetical protein [Cryobacterium sp. 10S3]MEB0286875.1 hypothetical protein [Cryobacterium sp. 10S3]WPX13443.1 hypothetical protein RHM57_17520 [Cryobacterium sp. 10S3]